MAVLEDPFAVSGYQSNSIKLASCEEGCGCDADSWAAADEDEGWRAVGGHGIIEDVVGRNCELDEMVWRTVERRWAFLYRALFRAT